MSKFWKCHKNPKLSKTTFIFIPIKALFWAIEKKSKTAENLLIVDFTDVTKIDSTAGEGIVEGLQFVLNGKSDFDFELRNISPADHALLVLCGLPTKDQLQSADEESKRPSSITEMWYLWIISYESYIWVMNYESYIMMYGPSPDGSLLSHVRCVIDNDNDSFDNDSIDNDTLYSSLLSLFFNT